jgi:hypothetical protein
VLVKKAKRNREAQDGHQGVAFLVMYQMVKW